jgi:hypothetical protein
MNCLLALDSQQEVVEVYGLGKALCLTIFISLPIRTEKSASISMGLGEYSPPPPRSTLTPRSC